MKKIITGAIIAALIVPAAAQASTAGQRNALSSAQQYLRYQAFSKAGLIDQLESPYGGQFTHAQAAYGVSKAYR